MSFQDNTSSGFAGFALKHPTTDEVVFAFRGTEFGGDHNLTTQIQDIYADLQLALPGAPLGQPNQFRDAYDFVKQTLETVAGNPMTDNQLSSYVTNNNTSFTGHSLGGGLVQYVIYQLDAGSAETFNAVGIGQVLGVSDPSCYNSMITDHVNADDPIGNSGIQLGQTIYHQGTANTANVDMHAIAYVVGILTNMISGGIPPSQGVLLVIDDATLNRLDWLAFRLRTSRTDVVRKAIDELSPDE